MVQLKLCQKNGVCKVMHSDEFKKAVGKFPTGVAVISTCYDDKLWGFTANSFVPVSLNPPLISFCRNKTSGSFEIFNKASHFAINILAGDQAEISKHFALSKEDKFKNIDYEISDVSGAPLIKNTTCIIECIKYKQFECGDHFIFVGEVIKTKINEDKNSLIYFAKSYKEIK